MLHSLNYDYLKRQRIKVITKLLIKMTEQKEIDRAWDLYLVNYYYMTKKNFVSFNDYLKQIKELKNVQSAEEIIKEMKKVKEIHQKNRSVTTSKT